MLKFIVDYNKSNSKYFIHFSINGDIGSLSLSVRRKLDNIVINKWYKDLDQVDNINNYIGALEKTVRHYISRLEEGDYAS